jgi:hypothetical protein
MQGIFTSDGEAKRFESLTSITTAAIGVFTAANVEYQGKIAQAVLITVETASIRFCIDGTTPTTTAVSAVGHKMDAGQSYVVRGQNSIRKFSCINEVAANGAVVNCTYFFATT